MQKSGILISLLLNSVVLLMNSIIIITTALLLLLCSVFSCSGQNVRFTRSGMIEFDRRINVHAVVTKRFSKDKSSYIVEVIDQIKKNQPQFKVLKSELYFSDNKTLFKPLQGEDKSVPWLEGDPTLKQINTVYTDLTTGQQVTQKSVFEELFLLKDTLRKINWKITNEMREIAGFNCRRANAVVMDSVYVVAFYAEQIPVSGGPESFAGLPGMILGLALPHDNTTWFATKVTDTPVESKTVAPPVKGKATDQKGLLLVINKATRSWGEYFKAMIRFFML